MKKSNKANKQTEYNQIKHNISQSRRFFLCMITSRANLILMHKPHYYYTIDLAIGHNDYNEMGDGHS